MKAHNQALSIDVANAANLTDEFVVAGDNESEILKLLSELPKST